jgi:uncharacterized membrane-anchored protein
MSHAALRSLRPGAVLLLPFLLLPPLAAQQEAEPSPWTHGPATVTLGDGLATFELAEGYQFADGETTAELMQMLGNPPTGLEVGLVAPSAEGKNWFIVFEHNPVGYVDDSDSDEIDAQALLDSISQATEANNEQRRELGGGELHVVGWTEAPHYDPQTNNLVWALEAEDESEQRVVNYNVRLLGRKGFVSATLVTAPALLVAEKGEIEALVADFRYNEGSRYADFVSGDKLAGYGLAALVAGGAGAAAAKLGLFAVLFKFLGKAWKVVVVGAVALLAGVRRFFSRSAGALQPPPAD